MNWFTHWFLKRTFRQEVKQGHYHDLKISNLYAMIREAAENEFTEDNAPTIDAFLRECFERAQYRGGK